MKTDDVINLLVQDLPSPVVDANAVLRRWLPVAALLAGIGFLAVAGVRADLMTAGVAPTVMKFSLGALLAVAALAAALGLSRPEVPLRRMAGWLLAVAAGLIAVVMADVLGQGLGSWQARLFGKGILPCLTLVPLIAAMPLAASLMALRRGASSAPGVSGALAGLASAGLSIVAYGFFCTEDSPLFVATWYSLAAVITALAGAVLGRKLLRW